MRAMALMLVAAFFTNSVAAQNMGPQGTTLQRNEGVASIGLTIPFGGVKHPEPPRVELRIARDVVNWDGSRQSLDGRPIAETRIGMALTPGNRLLVNGRPVEKEHRQGISTLGIVAIGVGIGVAVLGVVAISNSIALANEDE